MSQPFVGEIRMVGFNFNPRGWQLCNGQLLPISQYSALFALLGTTYGGNGTTTFALPNLQSRVPIHQGTGPGLSTYVIGGAGGVENVTLLNNQMPAHNHMVNCQTATGTVTAPAGNYPAGNQVNRDTGVAVDTTFDPATTGTMNPAVIGLAGGSQPHANLQPYLTVNFIIAIDGIFPSRN